MVPASYQSCIQQNVHNKKKMEREEVTAGTSILMKQNSEPLLHKFQKLLLNGFLVTSNYKDCKWAKGSHTRFSEAITDPAGH